MLDSGRKAGENKGQHEQRGNAAVPSSTESQMPASELPVPQNTKSPAFSFYAKDWLAATLTWTLDARGAYATLLAYQWDSGGVPGDDSEALARVLGVSKLKARAVWVIVSSKFVHDHDGLWRNERLEVERQKQAARREALRENGARGGRPRNQTPNQNETYRFSETEPNENLNKSLSSSSSFASSGDPLKSNGSRERSRL